MEKTGTLPDYVMACVGGGSNAIGLFSGFLNDSSVNIVGVEPGGKGLETGLHAAPLCTGEPGTIHGFKCYVVKGTETHSIAAGLDYPGVGPEHSHLRHIGRAQYVSVTDKEALEAFNVLCKLEGIIPALESAHAVAHAIKLAPTLTKEQSIIVNLSGRGDKDVQQVYEMENEN